MDSIALRYFARSPKNPGDWPDPQQDSDEINLSPDGEHFFVISSRGDVYSDAVIYRLEVYDFALIRRALAAGRKSARARYKFEFRSFSNEPGIRNVKWSPNSAALLFLAMSNNRILQVHKLDMGTGRLTQVTSAESDVTVFDESNRTVAYSVKLKLEPISKIKYPSSWGKIDHRVGLFEDTHDHKKRYTYIVEAGHQPRRLDVDVLDVQWDNGCGAIVSPSGRWVVVANAGHPAWMINVRNGSKTKLVERSNGPFVWAKNSSKVSFRERNTDSGPYTLTSYVFESGQWVKTLAEVPSSIGLPSPPIPSGINVKVRQGTNDPPTLVASYETHEIVLSEPDAVLQRTWLARSEPFSWKEPNGDTITGGLMLPRNYLPGTKLPLVIQAYYYFPQFFLPDGPHAGTSDTAQSLVARGFAVLQIDMVAEKYDPSNQARFDLREAPAFVERIDTAVSALASQGVVEPTRVGLTGFSRGGYLTYQTITHPRQIRLAACVIDDSYTGSYADYLQQGQPASNQARNYGAEFWANREEWLRQETTFNVDRVQTPAFFIRHNSTESEAYRSIYGMPAQMTIGAFRLNKRPIEYLFFRDGKHMLVRPQERLSLYTAVVDWMSFWLQGRVPLDKEKAERWLKLRKQQEAVNSELAAKGEKINPLPPLVPPKNVATENSMQPKP